MNSQTLSTEQEKTVNAAEESLTKEQKEQVKFHQEKIAAQNEEDHVPGTSQNKGKAIDPWEWGNASIATEELNIDIQKAILDAYERGRKAKKGAARIPEDRMKGSTEGSENEENFHLPVLSPVPRHKSVALLGHAQVLGS